MAFMGMFMAFIAVVAIVLGISAFIVAVCFISSGLVMVFKRKKNKDGEKVKTPWYVIVLRIVGCLASLPLILALCLVIYAVIASAVDKRTNLARAVSGYDYETAEQILQNGADPDVRDEYGRTLLMCITAHDPYVSADDKTRYDFSDGNQWNDDDDIKMMEILLEYGADVNAAVTDCGIAENHEYSEDGWNSIYANSDHYCGNTALIYAVRYRSADIVEFLTDNGADVNKANSCGFTPILMCADMRTDDDEGLEIATILMNEGADPHAVTNFHQDIIWLLTRQNTEGNQGIAKVIESGLR